MSCTCTLATRQWLTSISEPTTAEAAVGRACPCCGAPAGKRCAGALAGWLPNTPRGAERRAYVFVCRARLEVQEALL
jgi:hypothetical protein